LGLSQADLAERVGVDRSTIARCEQGLSTPRPWYRPLWADALGVSLEELDWLLADRQEEDVDRREFLQGAIVTTASVFTAGRNRYPDGSGDGDVAGLKAAVQRATRLERATQYAALDVVLPGLLVEAAQVADRGADPVANGLLSKAEALHAWLLIKRNLPDEAEMAAGKALIAARDVDDACLAGAALRCLGEVHMRAGRYSTACDLSIEAAELVKRTQLVTSDALAMMGAGYLSAAMACARGGDGASASELLEAANACAAQLGRDVSAPAVFGPSNLDIHRVAIPMELGDPMAALQQAERTRLAVPDGLEERSGRYLIDVARAYAARGRGSESMRALLHAEQIASEEVRTHRLTRAVLLDLLAREHRARTPELRAMASRCGVLDLS
jgi:Helix-turn-helix domain